MADALCGPSNPLQNLQKHSQIDRTLQQDRLVGRQSPGQGFRTADPRAGSLDADFHAFEHAGPSNAFQFQQPPPELHGQPLFFPPPQAPAQQVHAASGGWAADFQRLNIGEGPPLPAGQFRAEAPLVRSTVGGWPQEVQRMRPGAAVSPLQRQPVMDVQMTDVQMQGPNYTAASFQGHAGAIQPMWRTGMENAPAPQQRASAGQHVDFEAAFAEAFAHAQEMDHRQEEVSASVEPVAEAPSVDPGFKIGSDAIDYREKPERSADQDTRDADELARTAGQLLTSLQHDTSQKFQNSQFLNLMRRIRDREVEVQDNDLQNVTMGESATTTPQNATMNFEGATPQQQHEATASQSTSSHFEFPNMDSVYEPAAADLEDGGEASSSASNRYAGSWDYPPASAPGWKDSRPAFPTAGAGLRGPPYTTYGFEDDLAEMTPAMQPQVPADELHPGGRWYPDQSPPPVTADARERRISASDFERMDESAGLARRFS